MAGRTRSIITNRDWAKTPLFFTFSRANDRPIAEFANPFLITNGFPKAFLTNNRLSLTLLTSHSAYLLGTGVTVARKILTLLVGVQIPSPELRFCQKPHPLDAAFFLRGLLFLARVSCAAPGFLAQVRIFGTGIFSRTILDETPQGGVPNRLRPSSSGIAGSQQIPTDSEMISTRCKQSPPIQTRIVTQNCGPTSPDRPPSRQPRSHDRSGSQRA